MVSRTLRTDVKVVCYKNPFDSTSYATQIPSEGFTFLNEGKGWRKGRHSLHGALLWPGSPSYEHGIFTSLSSEEAPLIFPWSHAWTQRQDGH
jgi:hypothetical protein